MQGGDDALISACRERENKHTNRLSSTESLIQSSSCSEDLSPAASSSCTIQSDLNVHRIRSTTLFMAPWEVQLLDVEIKHALCERERERNQRWNRTDETDGKPMTGFGGGAYHYRFGGRG